MSFICDVRQMLPENVCVFVKFNVTVEHLYVYFNTMNIILTVIIHVGEKSLSHFKKNHVFL